MDTFRGGGRSEKSDPTFCLGRLGRPFFFGGGGSCQTCTFFQPPKKIDYQKKKKKKTDWNWIFGAKTDTEEV